MRKITLLISAVVGASLCQLGCAGSSPNPGRHDSGGGAADAARSDGSVADGALVDAGPHDAGARADGQMPGVDAGPMTMMDGGMVGVDAGPGTGVDAHTTAPDAHVTVVDAGSDAGNDAGNDAGTDAGPDCASLVCGAHASCSATGGVHCACDAGFTGDGTTCTDVNECAPGGGATCDVNAMCTNTPGSYTCACNPGYTGTGMTCTDVNECSPGGGATCDVNATCMNTPGSYTCTCNAGYTGTGMTCTDINECAPGGGATCDLNATCTNTAGGYTCACNVGYTGTGMTCTDINECAPGGGATCDAHASCTNTIGGYTCACNSGYTGTGMTCTDINECAPGGGSTCDALASCTNTAGSYTCTCPAGGTGDGHTTGTDCTYRRSCYDLLLSAPSTASGLYYIDTDGAGGPIAPFQVYCDMSTDGGGWTLVGRSVNGGAADLGCGTGPGGTNFGWRSATGAVTNDAAPYSLNVVSHGLTFFSEVLFGQRGAGKAWGPTAFKHTVINDFVNTEAAIHYQVGTNSPRTVLGACTAPTMFDFVGFTNNTDSFHFRDVNGNGYGLYANQWYSCYNNCNLGGNLNGTDGMVFVREKIEETSCQSLLPQVTASAVYQLDPDGPAGAGAPFPAYCDMQTAGGGWTLALKVDGSSTSVFNYDNANWTSATLVNPASASIDRGAGPGWTEAKLQSFNSVPFTQVLAALAPNTAGAGIPAFTYLPVTVSGTSLQARFSAGAAVATTAGRESWSTLVPGGGAFQPNCNLEGLNLNPGGGGPYARVRIGYVANQEADCGSPDSFAGIGGQTIGNGCVANTVTAGSAAGCGAVDITGAGAARNTSSFGAVFLRNIPARATCAAHLAAGITRSGTYPIDPDGAGPGAPFSAYCDMTTAGGGWTLVAIYGMTPRPGALGSAAGYVFTGNAYPRPAASSYGSLTTAPAQVGTLSTSAAATANNYSINAATLYAASGRQFLGYVSGTTRDYVTGTLPAGCNYFDGTTYCAENTYGPFTVSRSTGAVLTAGAYACTTAHNAAPWAGDPYNEFGLHLIDGLDTSVADHCYGNASTLGFQDLGRVFTSFNDNNGLGYWSVGVHSHWNEAGTFNQPGYLMIR